VAQANPADSHTFLVPTGRGVVGGRREQAAGTTDWQIEDEPTSGSIAGFSNKTYAAAGNHVTLYVSSTAPALSRRGLPDGLLRGKGGLSSGGRLR